MAKVSLSTFLVYPRQALSEVVRIRIVTVIGLLLLYEGLGQSGLLYKGVLPSLPAVGQALLSLLAQYDFYRHLGVTLYEVILGFCIGAFTGIALGISFGIWRYLGKVLDPWMHYLAPTPKIIFLPIMVLAFGTGAGSKIAMGAVSTFFPVVVATFAGVRLVRPVLLRVMATFQASTLQVVRFVYLPSLIEPLVASARIGLGAAIIGTLLAEIKMSSAGIGYLINQEYSSFRTPEMYALLVTVFILAWLANYGIERCAIMLRRH